MGVCWAPAFGRFGLGLGYLVLFSVLEVGGGSVKAWYSTALDFEEVLSGHVHVFVADVVKSFDTVNRGVLGLVLGCLGLPVLFRRTYFGYHASVRLRFGSSWCCKVHEHVHWAGWSGSGSQEVCFS